jgi:hypothetical protein
MIDLGTLDGLLEHRHELAAYCARCDRSPSSSLRVTGRDDFRFGSGSTT